MRDETTPATFAYDSNPGDVTVERGGVFVYDSTPGRATP
jgi:hypothetical protein